MLARIRKSQENGEGGFTLIELLVVMIIIGILAAIAIPAFLNQKKKARETSAKSDVSTIGKEIAAFYVDGTGDLTLATASGSWKLDTSPSAGTNGIASGKLSSGNTTAATGTAPNVIKTAENFCVSVQNGEDTSAWKFSATNGLQKGACATGDAS